MEILRFVSRESDKKKRPTNRSSYFESLVKRRFASDNARIDPEKKMNGSEAKGNAIPSTTRIVDRR